MKKPMKIGTYFGLWILFLSILSAVAVTLLVHNAMRSQSLAEAESKAELISDRNLATHAYFTKDLKPKIYEDLEHPRGAGYFEPVWMSSTYALRKIDTYFQNISSGKYYYRDAAINARSPENEADSHERAFLEKLNSGSTMERHSEIRYIDGQPYLAIMKKGESMETACHTCHTIPQLAPENMLQIYGSDRSFHRNPNEIVSVGSIRIPLAEAYGQADVFARNLSLLMIAGIIILFLFLYRLNKKLIIDPLTVIKEKAAAIAGNPNFLGDKIEKPSSRELSSLVETFNFMSQELKKNKDELDSRVRERTKQLEDVVKNLQEEVERRNQISSALEESETKYRNFFVTSRDCVFMTDVSGQIVDFNNTALEMLGYTEADWADAKSRHVSQLYVHPEDREKHIALVLAEGFTKEYPIDLKHKNGSVIHALVTTVARKNSDGIHIGFQGTVRDITDQKRDQDALRHSEKKYRSLFENMIEAFSLGKIAYDSANQKDFIYLEVNESFKKITGLSDPTGRRISELLPGVAERDPDVLETAHRVATTGQPEKIELFMNSIGKWLSASIYSLEPDHFIAVFDDISERRIAAENVRHEKEKLTSILNSMNDGVYIVNQNFDIEFVNPVLESELGPVEGKKCFEYLHGGSEPCSWCKNTEVFSGKNVKWEAFLKRTGKSYELFDTAIRNSDGTLSKIEFFHDITERKRMEDALRKSEQFLAQTERIARVGGWTANPRTDSLQITDGLRHILELPSDYHPNLDKYWQYYLPEYIPSLQDMLNDTLETGTANKVEVEAISHSGKRMSAEIRSLMRVDESEGQRVLGTFQDITERKQAEKDRIRLETAIEQAAESIIITDSSGLIVYVNPAFERTTGYTRDEAMGRNPRFLKSGRNSAAFYKQMWSTLKSGSVWQGHFVNSRKDGTLFEEESTISPVKDVSGQIVNYVAVKRDVTKEVLLQKQLLQAQKLEAVGTLAGGVAHDFNNILQVTLGYSELLLLDENCPEQFRSDIAKITESAKKGADLVQRLLTFSRKTEVNPKPIRLNQRIQDMQAILERTIPKIIDVKLSLEPEIWTINADSTQIDQVLLNLSVNARDAMPNGGDLMIKTGNVVLGREYADELGIAAGKYVLLTVSDTGTGMDTQTKEHIFEPFYTTKAIGSGTGLGLAMVYGIVHQHKGHIRCHSELGRGTTFTIYFPACD